jgi:hypothetical protein
MSITSALPPRNHDDDDDVVVRVCVWCVHGWCGGGMIIIILC